MSELLSVPPELKISAKEQAELSWYAQVLAEKLRRISVDPEGIHNLLSVGPGRGHELLALRAVFPNSFIRALEPDSAHSENGEKVAQTIGRAEWVALAGDDVRAYEGMEDSEIVILRRPNVRAGSHNATFETMKRKLPPDHRVILTVTEQGEAEEAFNQLVGANYRNFEIPPFSTLPVPTSPFVLQERYIIFAS